MQRFLTLALVLAIALGLSWQDASAAPARYTEGHADIGLGEGDHLELHLHAHTGAIIDGVPLASDAEYEPDEVIVVVPFASQAPRPAGSPWDPIGVAAGETFWYLSQTHQAGAPFLGYATDEIDDGVFDNDLVALRLIAMSGPGDFSVWQMDGFGNAGFFMSTADGIDPALDRIAGIPIPAHGHLNFGFTQPGTYLVTLEAYGTVGGAPQSDQGTFTFEVVPEPGTLAMLALAGLTGAALIFRRRRVRSA